MKCENKDSNSRFLFNLLIIKHMVFNFKLKVFPNQNEISNLFRERTWTEITLFAFSRRLVIQLVKRSKDGIFLLFNYKIIIKIKNSNTSEIRNNLRLEICQIIHGWKENLNLLAELSQSQFLDLGNLCSRLVSQTEI